MVIVPRVRTGKVGSAVSGSVAVALFLTVFPSTLNATAYSSDLVHREVYERKEPSHT